MISRFLNHIFPETCPVCTLPSLDHRTAPICGSCWEQIQPYSGQICQRCGKPLVSDLAITCGQCLKEEPSFSFARSFGLYEGVLKKAINLFKYYGIKRLSGPLSDIILRFDMPTMDAVIPVPLHKNRLRQREFNQSALLAKQTAKHMKKQLVIDCLIKVKETVPQVGLRSRDRMSNIKNAFSVIKPELIKNRNLLLIDDVVTTGSTIRECATILKNSGAGEIYVMSLAHGIIE